MKHFFFWRLALTNIKNNSKTYFPYIITCIGTILMFYNMCALTFHQNTLTSGSVTSMLLLGSFVTAIFCAIFLFYTNSFLVKRRKKEFGLFNILGMEKKHIGKVMLCENIFVSAFSIVCGLILGILFSKLITLFLYKILRFNPRYNFEISINALVITVLLFIVIFSLTLLSSLWQVKKARPVELLSGGNVGEKEPKSNWILATVGILSLGSGYFLALSVQNPLVALGTFMIATILVIIGTYCLFTAGSVVFLKLMKKNKGYYYQTKHFVSLSSMIFRMKKNAVGLANICIMSTAVLVMISTTISMYIGMEDLMSYRFPKDVLVTTKYTPETRPDTAQLSQNIRGVLEQDNMGYTDYSSYEFLNFNTLRKENTYTFPQNNIYGETADSSVLVVLPAQEYTKLTGEAVTLKENEIVLGSTRQSDTIEIAGQTFVVKESTVSDLNIGQYRRSLTDIVFVIVQSPQVMDELYTLQKEAYEDNASRIQYTMDFNFTASDEEVIAYCNNDFTQKIFEKNTTDSLVLDVKQMSIAGFYELYGGLFFLGIFLGTLFLIATVLIIYYKQVVEGFEDRERFTILQNVGMSKEEVRRSIGSQILTVFALPIVVAIIHIAVAFPILTKLLILLNLTNVTLFLICTVITIFVFALIYTLLYFLTSKVYYKIINS